MSKEEEDDDGVHGSFEICTFIATGCLLDWCGVEKPWALAFGVGFAALAVVNLIRLCR